MKAIRLPIVILGALIINLLINPAVTSGYAWEDTADSHSLRNQAVAEDCASDNYVESATYRWGNSYSRQGHQPDSLFTGIAATTAVALIPLPERKLNNHRLANPSPRIPDQILHHRTIVLLI